MDESGNDNTEAGPDGRLWTVAHGGLRVFDGEAWTDGGMRCDPWAVAVGGDGTVWALGDEGLMWTLPGGEGFATSDWADVYDGEALEACGDRRRRGVAPGDLLEGDVAVPTFLHFDGSAWQVVPAPDGIDVAVLEPSMSDRTARCGPWADSSMPHHSLARLDDAGWTVFTEADGVQPWGHWKQMGGPSSSAEISRSLLTAAPG